MHLLQQDFGIEYKTMREHFACQKTPTVSMEIPFILQKSLLTPSREPPEIQVNNLSKIVSY